MDWSLLRTECPVGHNFCKLDEVDASIVTPHVRGVNFSEQLCAVVCLVDATNVDPHPPVPILNSLTIYVLDLEGRLGDAIIKSFLYVNLKCCGVLRAS